MLSMKKKKGLLNTIKDVNDDETIMKEWILEEIVRFKNKGELIYVREEGIEKGKLQLIENNR